MSSRKATGGGGTKRTGQLMLLGALVGIAVFLADVRCSSGARPIAEPDATASPLTASRPQSENESGAAEDDRKAAEREEAELQRVTDRMGADQREYAKLAAENEALSDALDKENYEVMSAINRYNGNVDTRRATQWELDTVRKMEKNYARMRKLQADLAAHGCTP